MKLRYILNAMVVLILICTFMAFSTPAAAAGVVSIDVPAQVTAGNDFTAKIDIANVANFDVAQYDITYDPSIIQVKTDTDGTPLVTNGNIGGTTIPVAMKAQINSNTIRVINNILGTPPNSGATGSGYLADVHFHVVGAAGTSSFISLTNGLLGNKDAEQIPATWPPASSVQVSGSGSSGGGGGGGSGGGSYNGVTNLAQYTMEDGTFVYDFSAASVDGIVKLDIPNGTIGQNRNGQRLSSISIKENLTPPVPPADVNYVCLNYDIGPSGATFDPPIYLTFNYSESQVPAGVAEENMVLATWLDGKWIPFEDCVVNPVNNTITVRLNHFSTFTVLAHTSPASFVVSGLTISPIEVHPDENVTVSATVTNTGDLTGSFYVSLKINNLEAQSETVTLNGGQVQAISFTVVPDKTGEYAVEVNGLSSKYTVKMPPPEGTVAEVPLPAPASFIISGLSISPGEVNPNEEVKISTLVTNIGGTQGSYILVLKINNRQEAEKEVVLEGNESQQVFFTIMTNIEGNNSVDINGKAGTFNVIVPKPTLPNTTDEIPYVQSTNWPLYVGVTAALGGIVVIGLSTLITLHRRSGYRINGK